MNIAKQLLITAGLALLPVFVFVFIDRGVSIFAQCRHYSIISTIIQKESPALTEASQTASIILGFIVLAALMAFGAITIRLILALRSYIESAPATLPPKHRHHQKHKVSWGIYFKYGIALGTQIVSTFVAGLSKFQIDITTTFHRSEAIPATCALDDFENAILNDYYKSIPASFGKTISPDTFGYIFSDNIPFFVSTARDSLFLLVIIFCILGSAVTFRFLQKSPQQLPQAESSYHRTTRLLFSLISSASMMGAASMLLTSSIFKLGETLYTGTPLKFIAASRFNALLLLNIEFTMVIIITAITNLWVIFHRQSVESTDAWTIFKAGFGRYYGLAIFGPTITLLILESVSIFSR